MTCTPSQRKVRVGRDEGVAIFEAVIDLEEVVQAGADGVVPSAQPAAHVDAGEEGIPGHDVVPLGLIVPAVSLDLLPEAQDFPALDLPR
jgi:hypothetical protein